MLFELAVIHTSVFFRRFTLLYQRCFSDTTHKLTGFRDIPTGVTLWQDCLYWSQTLSLVDVSRSHKVNSIGKRLLVCVSVITWTRSKFVSFPLWQGVLNATSVNSHVRYHSCKEHNISAILVRVPAPRPQSNLSSLPSPLMIFLIRFTAARGFYVPQQHQQ